MLLLLACAPKMLLPEPAGLPTLDTPPGPTLSVSAEGLVNGMPRLGPLSGAGLALPGEVPMGTIGPLLGRLAAGGAREAWLVSGTQGARFSVAVGDGEGSPVPAMELGIWPDKLAWQRGPGAWTVLPDKDGAPDLIGLMKGLKADREAVPGGGVVAIASSSSVTWARTGEVLGVVAAVGYETRVIRQDEPGPSAPAGMVARPAGWSWEVPPWLVVDLPATLTGVAIGGPRLTLSSGGQAWVDRREVSGWAASGGDSVSPLTAALQAGQKPSEVRVFVDGALSSGQLRLALSAARAAGAERVGLISNRQPDQALPMELRGSVWPAALAGSQAGKVPITVEMSNEALYVGRGAPLVRIPHRDGRPELTALMTLLRDDRPTSAADRAFILSIDDPIPVAEALVLIDALQQSGFSDPWLTGGPATSRTVPTASSLGGSVKTGKVVSIASDGTLTLDGKVAKIDEVTGFYESCSTKGCHTVATLRNGESWYLGMLPERPFDDPYRGLMFQRPVGTWTGTPPKKWVKPSGFSRTLVGARSEVVGSSTVAAKDQGGRTGGSRDGSSTPESRTALGSTATTTTVSQGQSSGDMLTDAVVSCYTAAMSRNPAVQGRIVVTATVASDGQLIGTVLSSSQLGDSVADTCIVAAVQKYAKVTGAKSTGITTVQFPFTLSPG